MSEIQLPFTGRCACGEITYSASAKPIAMFNCHCGQCQLASGGTFVSVALVKEDALEITKGQANFYRSIGDSGRWTERGFC